MDLNTFELRMQEIDKKLGEKGIQIFPRSLLAINEFEPIERIVMNDPPNPQLGPYEGINLVHSIQKWYEKHYPAQMHMKEMGQRPLLIRGEVFTVRVPLHFNPSKEIPVRDQIVDIADELWNMIESGEKSSIQIRFNVMYWEIMNLNLLSVTLERTPTSTKLISDLAVRGLSDLTKATRTFNSSDPHAVVWDCQQGIEKYLKSYLLMIDPTMDESKLRKISHNNMNLIRIASEHDPRFHELIPFVGTVNYGSSDRYKVEVLSRRDAIIVIDSAYHVSNCTAKAMLALQKNSNAA